MATAQELITKKKYLLSRARSVNDPIRVAELEKEIVDLQREHALMPPKGEGRDWECLVCDRTFDLPGAIKARRACPGCSSIDTIRPLVESGLDINLRPGDGLPPQKPVKVKTAPPKGKPKPKKRDEFVPCPCGCGQIPEGRGIFMPGHDGRIAGWIRKVITGRAKGEDFGPEFMKIIGAWIRSGKPGGDHHPQIKKVVEGLRAASDGPPRK